LADKIITVTVEEGLIQSIEGIPPGHTVRVLDFDTEGADESDLTQLPSGKKAWVSEFHGEDQMLPQAGTRNTPLLVEIINVLDELVQDKPAALSKLEDLYQQDYVLNAGDVEFVSSAADDLRLRITADECLAVLDYIAEKGMVGLNFDHVETAINELFQDRFVEPGE